MIRVALFALTAMALTALTQLGGIALIIALLFKRRKTAFAASYIAVSIAALWIAPLFGRTPLPCLIGDSLKMHSPFFCVLNRQYVTPELAEVLTDYDTALQSAFPQTKTRVLDANFPFHTGFPLLPHLSHNDGRKVDLAFYYMGDQGYLPAITRSPLGYFAFEDGYSTCPGHRLTLRWDMAWLQTLWPAYKPDRPRMQMALNLLAADPRITKIFIEPHLKQSLGATSPKIRFQGCRAARHDDHIHIQL